MRRLRGSGDLGGGGSGRVLLGEPCARGCLLSARNGKYLTVDYRPFFPIGLYQFPDRRKDDEIWKEAAEAGFNFVLADEPGKHGMYVSRRIPTRRIDGRTYNLIETHRDPSLVEALKQFLRENEQDPTNLCWHSTDEPEWFGPSYQCLCRAISSFATIRRSRCG